MTLDQAQQLIKTCLERMDAVYGRVVFDEWALVSLENGKGSILGYSGPRKEGFKKNFQSDAGTLWSGLRANHYTVGDFEFARHGVGTGFESFMVVGKGVFLICNNTVQTMDAIAKDPSWLSAQVPFVELSETLRNDPISTPPSASRSKAYVSKPL